MTYEYKGRKIVCVIGDNLEPWQAMNIVGHLAVGLGANKDGELMGRNVLIDASGNQHKGIARYGFIIKKGDSAATRGAVEAARKSENILTLDFPREMLTTSHDDELAEWVLKKEEKSSTSAQFFTALPAKLTHSQSLSLFGVSASANLQIYLLLRARRRVEKVGRV